MVRATQITCRARDMARGALRFGVDKSFAIAHSHYENIDLAPNSQGFMPVYTNTELDDIEREVAPLVHDLSTKIEDEIIPRGVSLVK